jgi:hypothetical protein
MLAPEGSIKLMLKDAPATGLPCSSDTLIRAGNPFSTVRSKVAHFAFGSRYIVGVSAGAKPSIKTPTVI